MLISPFTPFIAEDLLTGFRSADLRVWGAPWPQVPPEYAHRNDFECVVQVNGKKRGALRLPRDLGREETEARVLREPTIAKLVEGRNLVRVVVVPNRLVNLVAR